MEAVPSISFIFHNVFYFSLPLISSIIIMSQKLLPWNTMQLNDLVVVDGIDLVAAVYLRW